MDNKEIDRRIRFLLSEINELKKAREVRTLIPVDLEQNAYEMFVEEDLKGLSTLIRRFLFGEYYMDTRFDGTQFLRRKPIKKIRRMDDLSNEEYEAYCFAYKHCFWGIVNAISKIRDTEGEENVAEEHEQAGHGDVHPGEPGPVS